MAAGGDEEVMRHAGGAMDRAKSATVMRERVLLGVGMDGERFRIYARAETH